MEEALITLSFGLLEEGKREVTPCFHWKVQENQMGIFMIQGAGPSILQGTLVLEWDGQKVWESPIRRAPKQDLIFPFDQEGEVYISAKALKEEVIPYGDEMYEVTLVLQEEVYAAAVLPLEEGRPEREQPFQYPWQEQRNEEAVAFSLLEYISEEKMQEGVMPEAVEEIENIVNKGIRENFEALEEVEVEGMEEREFENFLEDTEIAAAVEAREEIHPIEDTISLKEIEEEQNREEDQGLPLEQIPIKPEEPVFEKMQEEIILDRKTVLFHNLASYAPLRLEINKREERSFESMKKNIVIEKIGDFYITVLHDFLSRPVYFLYNGEQIVHWEQSFEAYLQWMKQLIGKMYNVTSAELSAMEKLVIVTEASEQVEVAGENLSWMTRAEAIEHLSCKYASMVDVTLKSGVISYTEGEIDVHMVVQGLGGDNYLQEELLSSMLAVEAPVPAIESWTENIVQALKGMKEVPTLFLGLAAFPALYEKLTSSFTLASELPFVSLAWEI